MLYAHTSAEDKQNNNTTAVENTFNANDNDIGFGATVGYSFVWGKFYLGGDLFLNYLPYSKDGGNQTINGVTSEVAKVKSNYSAGADLRIGGLLTRRVLLYGLAGVEVSKFDVTSESSSIFSSNKESKTVFGIAPGIGLEYALTKNWAISTQLKYIIYSKIKDDYTRPGAKPSSINNKYDISRTEFLVGLDYHFD